LTEAWWTAESLVSFVNLCESWPCHCVTGLRWLRERIYRVRRACCTVWLIKSLR